MDSDSGNFFGTVPEQTSPQLDVPYLGIIGWSVGALIFIVILALVIRKMRIFFRRPDIGGTSREELKKRWQSIEDLLGRGDETSAKLAIIEADNLLDHTLKSIGFGGETMGERLKLVVYKYPRVRSAWQGHTIRNRLVHDMSYHVSIQTARSAIRSFREALLELGVV